MGSRAIGTEAACLFRNTIRGAREEKHVRFVVLFFPPTPLAGLQHTQQQVKRMDRIGTVGMGTIEVAGSEKSQPAHPATMPRRGWQEGGRGVRQESSDKGLGGFFALGASWSHLGVPFGLFLGPLRPTRGSLRALLGHRGPSLGNLGGHRSKNGVALTTPAPWGPTNCSLGPSSDALGALLGTLGTVWSPPPSPSSVTNLFRAHPRHWARSSDSDSSAGRC